MLVLGIIVILITGFNEGGIPSLVWPLGNQHYAEEILTNSHSTSDNTNNDFIFSGSFLQLPYTPVDISGDPIDIHINNQSSFSDFTFAVYVFPRTNTEQMIFSYRSNEVGIDTFEIEVRMADFSRMCVKVEQYAGQKVENCRQSNDMFQLGQWIGVWMSFKQKAKLSFEVAGSMFERNTLLNYPLRFPGIMRFGGSFLQTVANWNGLMTCGLFYNFYTTSFNGDEYQHCNVSGSMVTEATTPSITCAQSDSVSLNLFSKVYTNAAVVQNMSVLGVSKEHSATLCSVACLKYKKCQTYVYDDDKLCRLYIEVSKGDIESKISSAVYGLVKTCK